MFTPRSPCLNRSRSCADPMVSTPVCGDTGLRGAAAGDDWTSQIGYICLPSPVIFVRWLFVTRCIIPITCLKEATATQNLVCSSKQIFNQIFEPVYFVWSQLILGGRDQYRRLSKSQVNSEIRRCQHSRLGRSGGRWTFSWPPVACRHSSCQIPALALTATEHSILDLLICLPFQSRV